MIRTALATLAAALTLAACSSSSAPGSVVTVTRPAPSESSSVFVPTTGPVQTFSKHPPNRNKAACRKAAQLVTGPVRTTFIRWHPNRVPFDQRVSRELRSESTRLFSIAGTAHGSTARAIHGEAQGLARVSIAIHEFDAGGMGRASDAANASLADLRGTCNF